MVPLYRPWFWEWVNINQSHFSVNGQSCLMQFNLSIYFSLTWCLERKVPFGKKPVSLSRPPMAGEVRRSFSGDDDLIPPPYRALPAQTAPEAFQPPRNSQEFNPSLQTGNWSQQCFTGEWKAKVKGVMCWLIQSFFPFFFLWISVDLIFSARELFILADAPCYWINHSRGLRISEEEACGVGYWESWRGSAN